MKAILFAILEKKMQEFINSNERCNEGDFFVGEQTVHHLAKGAEAVYDGMKYGADMEQSEGE